VTVLKPSLLAVILLGLSAHAAPVRDSPIGLWKTIDDRTHKPRGMVRIYEHEGSLYGRIEHCFDPAEAKAKCEKCPADQRNHPIIGLIVLRGLKKHGANEYSGGQILDPDNGSVYRCRLTLEDHGMRLDVRGYLGLPIAGRSQTWVRAE
jgi:uncharacterized protein (DUF2147 family)